MATEEVDQTLAVFIKNFCQSNPLVLCFKRKILWQLKRLTKPWRFLSRIFVNPNPLSNFFDEYSIS
jgi:hypothetical protein